MGDAVTRIPSLLTATRERGVRFRLAGGEVQYQPPDALDGSERHALRMDREEIVAVLMAVDWRRDAMHSQVPPAGPIPLLMARPGIRAEPGTCCSCGEPLDPSSGARYRCELCTWAAKEAIEDTVL